MRFDQRNQARRERAARSATEALKNQVTYLTWEIDREERVRKGTSLLKRFGRKQSHGRRER